MNVHRNRTRSTIKVSHSSTTTRTSAQSPEERATFAREGAFFIHQGAFHSPLEYLHNHRKKEPYSNGRESPSFTRGVSFTRGRFIHMGRWCVNQSLDGDTIQNYTISLNFRSQTSLTFLRHGTGGSQNPYPLLRCFVRESKKWSR